MRAVVVAVHALLRSGSSLGSTSCVTVGCPATQAYRRRSRRRSGRGFVPGKRPAAVDPGRTRV